MKAEVKKKYDHTINERADRHRKALAVAGGARVEAKFDACDVAKLDAIIEQGDAKSRSAAVKFIVANWPAPAKSNKTA